MKVSCIIRPPKDVLIVIDSLCEARLASLGKMAPQ
jgi:hypothetical protein